MSNGQSLCVYVEAFFYVGFYTTFSRWYSMLLFFCSFLFFFFFIKTILYFSFRFVFTLRFCVYCWIFACCHCHLICRCSLHSFSFCTYKQLFYFHSFVRSLTLSFIWSSSLWPPNHPFIIYSLRIFHFNIFFFSFILLFCLVSKWLHHIHILTF